MGPPSIARCFDGRGRTESGSHIPIRSFQWVKIHGILRSAFTDDRGAAQGFCCRVFFCQAVQHVAFRAGAFISFATSNLRIILYNTIAGGVGTPIGDSGLASLGLAKLTYGSRFDGQNGFHGLEMLIGNTAYTEPGAGGN